MRFKNYLIIGLMALAGCGSPPEYVNELLAPKKERFGQVCDSYGKNQARFDQDSTLAQISAQKGKILEALDCGSECLQWICGRNEVFEDFKFYERQNHCRCPYDSLPEAFRSLSEGEIVRLKRALSE